MADLVFGRMGAGGGNEITNNARREALVADFTSEVVTSCQSM